VRASREMERTLPWPWLLLLPLLTLEASLALEYEPPELFVVRLQQGQVFAVMQQSPPQQVLSLAFVAPQQVLPLAFVTPDSKQQVLSPQHQQKRQPEQLASETPDSKHAPVRKRQLLERRLAC